MKFILAIFVITSLNTFAQNVTIPDNNFKNYLISNSAINSNFDSEIQLSEAQTYSGQINCASMSISDLTGIEAFTSLTNLNCSDNQLSSINVSSNLALTHLSVYNNNLASIDLTQNNALTFLWCMFNELTSLDVSQNNNLIFLQANNNELTTLNIANGNNSNVIGCTTNNNNLSCIQVDNETFSTNNWIGNDFGKDVNTSYSENCSASCAITNITVDDVSPCYPATNSYSITITTTYENSGSADSLHIGGFGMPTKVFQLTQSPQTVIVFRDFDVNPSAATNLSVWLTSSSDVEFSCIHPAISGAWVAPEPCGITGINEVSPNSLLNIYPNPIMSILNIEAKENTNVRIVNSLGQIVMALQLNTGENSISVSNFHSGVYFIHTENGSTTKFIKK